MHCVDSTLDRTLRHHGRRYAGNDLGTQRDYSYEQDCQLQRHSHQRHQKVGTSRECFSPHWLGRSDYMDCDLPDRSSIRIRVPGLRQSPTSTGPKGAPPRRSDRSSTFRATKCAPPISLSEDDWSSGRYLDIPSHEAIEDPSLTFLRSRSIAMCPSVDDSVSSDEEELIDHYDHTFIEPLPTSFEIHIPEESYENITSESVDYFDTIPLVYEQLEPVSVVSEAIEEPHVQDVQMEVDALELNISSASKK